MGERPSVDMGAGVIAGGIMVVGDAATGDDATTDAGDGTTCITSG